MEVRTRLSDGPHRQTREEIASLRDPSLLLSHIKVRSSREVGKDEIILTRGVDQINGRVERLETV